MSLEIRRQHRLAMRGIPERLGLSFQQGSIEMRAKPNGTAAGNNFAFNGYCTVYGYSFPMWDMWGEPYTESVASGATKRSLSNPNLDVPFLIGHNDAGIPLARTKSGTMQLSSDTHGTYVQVPSMDGNREEVRALASAVERGDMDEMSCAFMVTSQEWDENFEHRTVQEMDLHRGDVCAVVHGANDATAGNSMTAFPVESLSLRRPVPLLTRRSEDIYSYPALVELRADMSTADINDLPDSDFAYIAPGGSKDSGGKTTPRSLRYFPIHDAAHVRNALARLPQSNLSDSAKAEAKTKIVAAAKKFGVDASDDSTASSLPLDKRAAALDVMDISDAPDYNADSHGSSSISCPNPDCAVPGGAKNAQDAKFCDQCGAPLYGEDGLIIDDDGGIPSEEDQLASTAKLELMRKQLELEELAAKYAA